MWIVCVPASRLWMRLPSARSRLSARLARARSPAFRSRPEVRRQQRAARRPRHREGPPPAAALRRLPPTDAPAVDLVPARAPPLVPAQALELELAPELAARVPTRYRASPQGTNPVLADPKEVTLTTDGACLGNPGPGGWAALLRSGPFFNDTAASEIYTTNNRMELT